jgi:hypothetical protein
MSDCGLEGDRVMKCNFERLITFLNNELDENQNHQVIAHLRNCQICLEAVATILEDQLIPGQIPQSSRNEEIGL